MESEEKAPKFQPVATLHDGKTFRCSWIDFESAILEIVTGKNGNYSEVRSFADVKKLSLPKEIKKLFF